MCKMRHGRATCYIQTAPSGPHLRAESRMISEFYHLRRTAIKDLAGYLGFLTGFIGSAPLAWGLLASQLESGTFVRGLWYFFGIVIAAGIFSGIAGLGIGYAGGLAWEQIHRHRRRRRALLKPMADPPPAGTRPEPPHTIPRFESPPKLHLVGSHTTTTVSPPCSAARSRSLERDVDRG